MSESRPVPLRGPRHAAVLGSPIEHSLSPVLHRAAYAALGLPWSYRAIECDEAGLPMLLGGLDDAYIGVSLTMPLKRAVLPLLHEVTPLAAAVGAVNTVAFEGTGSSRRRLGDNTDVAGMLATIRTATTATFAKAAVLGAGGTAAAAVAALRELGLREVDVVVRDAGRAGELRTAADRLGMRVVLVPWPGTAWLDAADLVVSTVPAGAADPVVSAGGWSPQPGQLLFDVLYEPWPTVIANVARGAGADVVGGLELLVQQAALQVERWSGRLGPVDVMRAAGQQVLEERSRRLSDR